MIHSQTQADLKRVADGFEAILEELDTPSGLEQAGFKRMKETRVFDDANVAITYPGGTTIADATVTHSFDYVSAFPDEETQIYFTWVCNMKLESNGVDNEPRGKAAILLPDGTVLTNVISFGVDRSDTNAAYINGSQGASGHMVKPADQANITFEQRCFMNFGAPENLMEIDSADLLVREYVL
ncbi:hypothetical protein [Planktotalea sp.]|uniref:hypothetical protein n=1 Tax=Planktotalea sp. TaxID=2029877 RepID=UPI003D6A4DB9